MAFMTLEESFEPTIIFFELTNSPAIFQTIMNKILQNLINTRASFIDDVIVGTKEKEGHNKIVKKIVKRLAENNLYIKLEKCKWKVREIEFLEVIIGLEGIKIKKEKVMGVLNWPTFIEVKNIQKFLKLAIYDLVKKD